MSIQLAKQIQKNLGYPALQEVNPDTQDIENKTPSGLLTQASVATVLAGIYRYSKNMDNVHTIFLETPENWLAKLFGDKEELVIEKVQEYTGASDNNVANTMNDVAYEAIKIIRKEAGNSTDDIRNLMTAERHDILKYLPGPLQMGTILNDNTLDDRTNKMEGPVSTFIHKVEEFFGSDPSKK
jgi:hypothetical protein